jgi:hypothetical protein
MPMHRIHFRYILRRFQHSFILLPDQARNTLLKTLD